LDSFNLLKINNIDFPLNALYLTKCNEIPDNFTQGLLYVYSRPGRTSNRVSGHIYIRAIGVNPTGVETFYIRAWELDIFRWDICPPQTRTYSSSGRFSRTRWLFVMADRRVNGRVYRKISESCWCRAAEWCRADQCWFHEPCVLPCVRRRMLLSLGRLYGRSVQQNAIPHPTDRSIVCCLPMTPCHCTACAVLTLSFCISG